MISLNLKLSLNGPFQMSYLLVKVIYHYLVHLLYFGIAFEVKVNSYFFHSCIFIFDQQILILPIHVS